MTEPLHPLLAWWAVLLALSSMARYEPRRSARTIRIDASPDANAVEHPSRCDLGGMSGFHVLSALCLRRCWVLIVGVIGAVVIGVMAVVLDAPAYLAFGATAAFVAIGTTMPFQWLARYLVTRQPKAAEVVPRAAVSFTTLGVVLSLFSTQAIEANDSVIRAIGWFAVVFVSAAGAIVVAGLRCSEKLNATQG
ncbi:hypothetical protein F1D05_31590 [Kribbella qitaiheensis]|uniref:Uncharacterized protein n=2 Tax=Kribbella qitaiheensis TaxID=1544730 RepID=A0A7G6X5X0_9ACTN|nr:hypothetical protein [Kribbella qitaiheensis]QNE21635.1 hypothetical protein F1D05_31590 [Kribbella qitaiheensis]